MGSLDLHLDQPKADLAASLRRAFSGIVAGNVKAEGVAEIEKHGPFKLHGGPGVNAVDGYIVAVLRGPTSYENPRWRSLCPLLRGDFSVKYSKDSD